MVTDVQLNHRNRVQPEHVVLDASSPGFPIVFRSSVKLWKKLWSPTTNHQSSRLSFNRLQLEDHVRNSRTLDVHLSDFLINFKPSTTRMSSSWFRRPFSRIPDYPRIVHSSKTWRPYMTVTVFPKIVFNPNTIPNYLHFTYNPKIIIAITGLLTSIGPIATNEPISSLFCRETSMGQNELHFRHNTKNQTIPNRQLEVEIFKKYFATQKGKG